MRRVVLALVLATFGVGCGKPFDVKTASGFAPLENQTFHAYRATTPEGVVFGIRVVDDEERADVGFWSRASILQLRETAGYALLDRTEVASADGTKGELLKFGHDQDNKPFTYWLSIFPAQGRLYLVEAGGAKDAFERARPNVEWMMKTVRVRCDSIVAPVLASRTCNRW